MTMRIIHGAFALLGKSPDGDSIRFIPDDPSLFEDLYRSHKMTFTKTDGSIQLRLEGIDTPETHYGKEAQPLGDAARDALLTELGYDLSQITVGASGVVTADGGQVVRGAIATTGADANGRPISFVFTIANAPGDDGDDVFITEAHVRASANLKLITDGHAYPGLYTSMWLKLRKVFRQEAVAARAASRGIWPHDASGDFRLMTQEDIGPDGALIMPKLFRRSTDYLSDVAKGVFAGNLSDWLRDKSGGSRPENDLVLLNDGTANAVEVPFSELVQQFNANVSFTPDVCTIAFVEK